MRFMALMSPSATELSSGLTTLGMGQLPATKNTRNNGNRAPLGQEIGCVVFGDEGRLTFDQFGTLK
jgi:hypothetical protein